MKYAPASLAANAVAIACVAGTVIMAMHDKPGWWWLLFAAILTSKSVKITSNREGEE